ncbi:MAG: hypothetical protein IPO66_16435 [Rhodanobacteraceae bacterium]|nr:hypothetical protein [Rhodanobacteraceae bacterium]
MRAGHVLLQRDYKQQAELLNALHQARGEDIFVASYFLGAKSESEPLFNYTQFTEGVTHALLPRADHLGFLTRAQELLVVPWSLAERDWAPRWNRRWSRRVTGCEASPTRRN